MQHRIVITRHRPWLKPLMIGGGAFVLAIGAWILYSYTRASTVTEFERARIEVEQLRAERRDLTRELRAAQEKVRSMQDQAVYVQRSQDIDTQACSAIQDSLAQLQAEASDLREQLAFYRGIVAPEQARAGVRVYEFRVFPGADATRYRYDLVLIQSVRHEARVGGRIDINLFGVEGGRDKSYALADLVTDEAARNLLFSLKYFEEFSGEFRIPDGFEPRRVEVTLVPSEKGAPNVDESYDWKRALIGGGG